jgi:hypothetical protein
MSTQRRAAEAKDSHPPDGIVNGASSAPAESALRDLQRSTDNAVMSIFELARSLEFLNEAIGQFNADGGPQLSSSRE